MPEFEDRASNLDRSLANILEQCSGTLEQTTIVLPLTSNDQFSQLTEVEGVCRRSHTTELTRIFACAALVYLNLVVYGPHPDHPKIQESVSQVVTSVTEVQNRSTLGMLAWPLCVAGCMATGWQVEYFRELSTDLENVSDLKLGNLKRSFLIVEECWRLRQETTDPPDWERAMDSLNMKILLI